MARSLEELTQQEKKQLVETIRKKKSGELTAEWTTIKDQFDLDVNSESLRKAGVGIKLADDAGMITEKTPNDLSDGYVERQKLRDLTGQFNAACRKESRRELLRETIREAIQNLDPIKPFDSNVVLLSPDRSQKQELVLIIGDVHYGANIHVEGLEGETINDFNSEVFNRRMNDLLSETVEIIKHHCVSKINLFLVGDLVDGMLRQSQLMKLEYGLVSSTMNLAEYMANWIARLGILIPVDVHAVSGNHSEVRPLGSKHREFPEENMERIIMWYLEERLKGYQDIHVSADCKRYKKVDVCGYSFLLLHGDGDKEIKDIANETIRLYHSPIDFFVCGHKHRENEFPLGMTSSGDSVVIRTPSICGVDSYANSKGYSGKAGAIAAVIEKGYGRRCVYPIILQ